MTDVAIPPGAAGYETARRGYNLLHDQRPALVVRPREPADVVRALALAGERGYEVAVRGGGHSLAGFGSVDGGLLLGLSLMDEIALVARERRVVAGGGVTAGPLTAATCEQGLLVPFGDSPSVGVGGITLGGGTGWLSRALGLTADSLLAAEVVTADGRVLLADDREHPDLFWALRGGGGNFGVVTRLHFRLHPIGPVLAGMLALPASRDVLRGVLDVAADAPDGLGTIALVTRLPPFRFAPEPVHGRPAVLLTLVWYGDPADGAEVVERFRALAPPLVDEVRVRPYPEMYALFGEAPPAVTNATHALMADDLGDDQLDAVLEGVAGPGAPTVLHAVELRVLGGAVARVPAEATAFAHRDRRLVCSVVAAGFDPGEEAEHRDWVRSVADPLRPAARGAYVNFIDASGVDRVDEAYPAPTRDRLAAVKAAYDPGNVFRRNLNIAPAEG